MGFETSLFNDRVFLDVDYYISKTTDQLFERQVPVMTGFTTIFASMGQVNNRGIELGLRTVNVRTNDFTWSSHATFWLNRNKLHSLYGDLDDDGNELDDIGNNLFIGHSLNAIYGYEFDGIVQEEDIEYIQATGASPGDAKFRDLNGDGLITADHDRKILGFSKQNFNMNLSNTFEYKGFSLYVLVQGIFGGGKDNYYVSQNRRAYLTASDRHGDNQLNHIWWTPENRSNVYPAVNYSDNRFLGLESRTFVRVQDVVLSYHFNNDWLQQRNIHGLRVFAAGQNLHVFTNWTGGGDPELGHTAMSNNYPVPATYSIGLDIKF